MQPQKQNQFVDKQVTALWEVGFVQPIDILMVTVFLGSTFTFIIWCIAQHAVTLAAFVVYFSAMNLTGISWCILLCFRACLFSIKTRANLEMLPEQAAAVLHGYLQQGVSEPKQPLTEQV